MSTYQIRPLDPRHDAALARVIRTTIAEFVPPDRQQFTSMADAQLDSLSAFYNTAQRKFWVIEDAAGEVWGGGGFAPLDEGPSDTCELQKCILILRFGVKVLVKRFYNSALGKLPRQVSSDAISKRSQTCRLLKPCTHRMGLYRSQNPWVAPDIPIVIDFSSRISRDPRYWDGCLPRTTLATHDRSLWR